MHHALCVGISGALRTKSDILIRLHFRCVHVCVRDLLQVHVTLSYIRIQQKPRHDERNGHILISRVALDLLNPTLPHV